ncbi:uncharacterized protein LOC123507090 [Portunus trituberculatus]|uniref:uncharacterized protein LOC123507090 n=1 Tax=Portunus trituberculatus TaxID=210409 RepID=UPI001E1D0F07|nr:uncharacterized protein LOC123507090 [Portunus trituberculatus]
MGEASWRRWCWWRECLVVVVVGVVASEAAGQQTPCEVLDSSLQSTFPLPTTLTLRPSEPQWRLDFAVHETHAASTACVRVEQKSRVSSVRFKLYRGTCSNGTLVDFGFLYDVTLLPTAWTLLQVQVKNNSVVVEPSGAAAVVLQNKDVPLSYDTLQVSAVQDVEAAVGCRVRCPHYKHSSGRGGNKDVLTTRRDNARFYFRPGEDSVRLQLQVTCTTTRGATLYPHLADITPSRAGWQLVEVRHHGGVAQVTLDNVMVWSRSCRPSALFTFSCNPVTGDPEWDGPHQWALDFDTANSGTAELMAWVAAGVNIVVVVVVCLVV